MFTKLIEKFELSSINIWYKSIGLAAILILLISIDPIVDFTLNARTPLGGEDQIIVAVITGIIGLLFVVATVILAHGLRNARTERNALVRHFEYLSKYAHDLVILVDENWKIVEVNDRALSMYGYTREEMKSLNPLELRISEERDKIFVQLSQLGTEDGIVMETVHRRKDGSTFPVEVSARRITTGGNKYLWNIVRDITERKRADEAILKQRDRLRNLAARVEKVREEERKSLARDIHDGLGQELTAIKMNISVLATRLKHDDAISEKIKSIRELIDTSILSARKLSMSLRPELLEELGLGSAIEWQVHEFEKKFGISCSHSIEHKPITVRDGVSIALVRILQEALTNVERHAAATQVVVKFEVFDRDVRLSIYDNGKGISEDREENVETFGIFSMKERAHEFGGVVRIKRLNEKGTKITVELPEALL
jgi:two-component system, NarL family, sensor histidine kinase UhpB